jgi:hypothetical protein
MRSPIPTGAVLGALVLFAGCRGLLDIEDLELVDDARDAGQDGAADVALTEAGPAADARPPDGSSPLAEMCRAAGATCAPCCKDNIRGQAPVLEEAMRRAPGCLCGDAGACRAQCRDEVCRLPTPSPPEKGTQCGPCVDGLILARAAACLPAFDACRNGAAPGGNCKEVMECLQACPGGGGP